MDGIADLLSAYNAGGARRAALPTDALLRIISYLDGLIAAGEDKGQSQSDAEQEAINRAAQ
jgi:hypothetical protein